MWLALCVKMVFAAINLCLSRTPYSISPLAFLFRTNPRVPLIHPSLAMKSPRIMMSFPLSDFNSTPRSRWNLFPRDFFCCYPHVWCVTVDDHHAVFLDIGFEDGLLILRTSFHSPFLFSMVSMQILSVTVFASTVFRLFLTAKPCP